MKPIHSKFILGSVIFVSVFSCKKMESSGSAEYASEPTSVNAEMISDSISSVASMTVKDKQFIKTASVDMEVKDVYDATVFIEKSLKDLGGFVTNSNLRSNVISENTFNTSDENAMLVKKYQTENTMKVRVPTEKLGDFLQVINDRKLFLNTRIIDAEDVTANIKFAEMEVKRIQKTGQNISTLKTGKNKVEMGDSNMSEENSQKLASINISDNLKYSTVDIYIKEPKLRIAEIPVINSKNSENKYKYNFFYDAKNAFVEGYYLIQMILVGLIRIWPLILIGFSVFFILKRRKITFKKQNSNP